MFPLFLTEIASHGIFVIASGPPNKEAGTTTSAWMKEAIEYITKNAGMGAYANVDATRIAAAGQSCGGLEAYDMANDTRVSAIGIFNSGYLSASQADKITKPIFYFLGGSSDIAYANVSRLFLPGHCSYPVVVYIESFLTVSHRAKKTILFYLKGHRPGRATLTSAIWEHTPNLMVGSLGLLLRASLGLYSAAMLPPLHFSLAEERSRRAGQLLKRAWRILRLSRFRHQY